MGLKSSTCLNAETPPAPPRVPPPFVLQFEANPPATVLGKEGQSAGSEE